REARGRRRPGGRVLLAAALAVILAACSGGGPGPGEDRDGAAGEPGAAAPAGPSRGNPHLLGDGSTALTGQQPNQPVVDRLEPGGKPPQFVVFSWDGAGEDGNRLFSRFREIARESDAHMTYFLTGIYLLPESRRDLYAPPGRSPGASDIGYLSDESIAATLEQLRGAWLDGSEIGTHFNGHFCGPTGVNTWTPEDWISETEQAKWMVSNWKTVTGWDHLEPLPFDYEEELVGGRTPCLEGRDALLRAAADLGLRYDSSGNGRQVWPDRTPDGVWDIPLQQVPMPGRSFEVLAMDYNFMVNQSGPGSGDPSMHPFWEQQTREGLLQGFRRAYDGNRAPLIIGNHFNGWNGGIYMRAVEDVIREICPMEDVRCVSFRQLVDWLDAQDPELLAALRTLDVGTAPAGGWEAFPAPSTVAAAPPGPGAGTDPSS
ncbi:hypothetical protein, partial [Streptomyces calidiresistens]|uniref:hypothetical protein n=1 Tax=Streptomyces calidiresistens TaxID=1485586 RepID=UPI003F68ED0E